MMSLTAPILMAMIKIDPFEIFATNLRHLF